MSMDAKAADMPCLAADSVKPSAESATDDLPRGKSLAAGADDAVPRLREATGRLGDLVKGVASLAQQANLLALNAAIEASRAGDAGHGFTVVAKEAKSLALQAAQTAETIRQQVSALRQAVETTVASTGSFSDAA